MVEIVSSSEVNKKTDADIAKNGGEKETDDIANIELLPIKEYRELSEEEKKQYVEYNPSLTSQAYVQWLNAQNAMVNQMNQLGPMIDKMSVFQGSTPPINQYLKKMKSINSIIDTFNETLGTIDGLKNVKIIGELAEPVFNIVTSLAQMISSLASMVYGMIYNPYQMIDAYYTTCQDIDFDEISFEQAKTTENIDLASKKVDKMVIPDKEIKDKIEEQKKTIDDMIPSQEELVKAGKKTKKVITSAKEALDTNKEILRIIGTMGLSIIGDKFLDSFEVNWEKEMNKMKDDKYTKQAKKQAKAVNDFINKIPKKYIKVEDLEKLKKINNENNEDKK